MWHSLGILEDYDEYYLVKRRELNRGILLEFVLEVFGFMIEFELIFVVIVSCKVVVNVYFSKVEMWLGI